MTEQFSEPPHDAPDDVTWPELLRLANLIAQDYRRALTRERVEHAAIVADLRRQLEIKDRLIRTFEISDEMQKGPR
jgi:hypothetical protein